MIKVLVLGSTDDLLKYKDLFLKSGLSIDFIIGSRNSSYDFQSLKTQSLLVDHSMIPFSKSVELTLNQNLKKNKIKNEIESLKHILFQNYKYFKNFNENSIDKNKSEDRKSEQNRSDQENCSIFELDQILDLSYHQKEKKIYLELKRSKILRYDHVCLEDSFYHLNKVQLKLKNQNLFSFKSQSLFQFIGLRYRLEKSMKPQKFWWMADSNYKSIYDNFYFIHFNDLILDIWFWLPMQQIENPMSTSYFGERVQKKMEEKFHFLNLSLESKNFMIQSLNTYFNVKSKFDSVVSFFPHFHFYEQDEVNSSITHLLKDISKKQSKRSAENSAEKTV